MGDLTGDVLVAMLTENTGIHMMDSGGAYGRSWQQNKDRDFASESAATISVEEGYIDIRRSTYHFLVECLEFDQPMNERFYAFSRTEDPDDKWPWLTSMGEFTEWLNATGVYGRGSPLTVNTHNHDSLLDQVIQYVYFEVDETGYVLLQIHGGCDVRGGYTAPKAFRCNIEASQSIFSDNEATITCKNGEEHRWYVQDGSWDTDHEDDADAKETRGLDEFPILDEDERLRRIRDKMGMSRLGNIWQDSDGLHCPLCGEVLEVW